LEQLDHTVVILAGNQRELKKVAEKIMDMDNSGGK